MKPPHRFLILPYSLPPSHIPHLLGRIVLDPLHPLKHFIPDGPNNGFHPSDVVPTLNQQQPLVSHDHAAVVRGGSSAGLRARLGAYLGVEAGASASQAVALRAPVVRRYEMANHAGVFRRFLAHEGYRALIEEILEEEGRAWMVVGFYTAEGGSWVVERTGGRRLGGDVKVPVVAGMLQAGADPAVGGEVEVTREETVQGRVEGEEIFAVAYRVVRKRHALDRTARGWVSSTPVLGDEKRVGAGHLAMGADSEEELEYESETESDGEERACVLDDDAGWMLETGTSLDYIEL